MSRLVHSWRLVCRILVPIIVALSPLSAPVAFTSSDLAPIPPCAVVLPTESTSTQAVETVSSALTTSTTPEPPTILSTATTTPVNITTTAVPVSAPVVPAPPRYDLLRLNELMPQPAEGKEWIEMTSIDPNTTVEVGGLRLRDRTGVIFTFASGTLDAAHPFVVATLSSSRLNNDGDDVSLVDPSGAILDTFAYLDSEKGKTWSRYPDGIGAWAVSDPTPDGKNLAPPIPPDEPEESEGPMILPAETNDEIEEPAPAEAEPTSDTLELGESIAPAEPEPVEQVPQSTTEKTLARRATTNAISTKKNATKKITTTRKLASASVSPLTITFDMINEDSNRGIRVRLNGVVRSPPGLLTGHAFILNAPDGRGLLVRVPTSRKLPEFGRRMSITGSLVFQDSGIPYLKLGAKDAWEVEAGEAGPVVPRTVDLTMPAAEDAWSVVAVTGTVRSVRGQTVTLEYAYGDLDIVIKPVANYRAARLTAGDTLTVVGFLDMTRESPRILPRRADDIAIIAHATPKKQPGAMSPLPGWTPLGAAGLAIAGNEGVKSYRERRKKRALEKNIKTDLNTMI
ncbi:lamin tail domain-containing protein [Candidatus Uhrbacteria bacterium]|nr:lamin tail domain-containing protein [Candidatus Uhrbacteria bacterium]